MLHCADSMGRRLDGALADRQWLVGDHFDVADLNVAAVLSPSRLQSVDSSGRKALERRYYEIAHHSAPLVPGVGDEAQPRVRPRARQMPGCIWWAGHVMPTVQQYAGDAS